MSDEIMSDEIQGPRAVPERKSADVVSHDRGTRQKKKQRTRQITVEISAPLYERVANAVYRMDDMTFSKFTERAFSRYIDFLERENGGMFKQRKKRGYIWKHGKRRVDIVI
jgi:hypothetical protein